MKRTVLAGGLMILAVGTLAMAQMLPPNGAASPDAAEFDFVRPPSVDDGMAPVDTAEQVRAELAELRICLQAAEQGEESADVEASAGGGEDDAGRAGEAGLEVYSGAKAGAAGFTRAVARSLGRHNITANCVAIAATLTPAIEARLKANPEMQKKMMEKYVIRRPGLPSDVANMVLFLASEASAWITGQTYPVNGGFTFAL